MTSRARERKTPVKRGLGEISDARVESIQQLNDNVEKARRSSDLLYRLITEASGTDLRALTKKISAHLYDAAKEYRIYQQRIALANEQQKKFASSFMQKQLTDDDLQSLHHLFDKLCGLEVDANDDKARIAQLAVVFSILTIDIDVRRLLVAPPKQMARFGAEQATGSSTGDDDRKAANLIDKSALTMFLTHDSRNLMSLYRDGVITTLQYVDRCITAYMAYMPTLDARVARLFYKTDATVQKSAL